MDLPPIENPFDSRLLLGNHEEIKILATGAIPYEQDVSLVITNQRLLIYGNEDWERLEDTPLSTLKGVSVVKNFLAKGKAFPAIKLYLHSETVLITIAKIRPNLSPSSIVDSILTLRIKERLRTEMSSYRDFSWLSSLIERGGVMVTSVNCPSCGAGLDIPRNGVYAKCTFCGRTAHVAEVVDILGAVL